jgi:uncharacterized protein YyaL (SSP411 family)
MLRRLAIVFALLLAASAYAKPNRLATEKSPYLRSHATNAVDWMPWGSDAFARAKKEDKPVFLSIGYASCHWCHVLSRESFDNPEIAKLINDYFVPVLVDREEHPDVDATYLAFVEATTRSGGWPMNLVLTPDLHPLLGTTYIKPDELSRLLVIVSNKWANERKAFLATSAQTLEMVRSLSEAPSALDVKAKEAIDSAVAPLSASFDAVPRFPQPSAIRLLLRTDAGRDAAIKILREMMAGSIYDQIGGGFHRYTVDAAWREPHYEKMLYDQAQLALAYLEAWQFTHDADFERVARTTLDCIVRDFRNTGGGFASGFDADSLIAGKSGPELVEGAFYRWSRDQFAFLGKRGQDIASYFYGIDETNALPYQPHSRAMTRIKFGGTEAEVDAEIESIRLKLLELRTKRPQPQLDTKEIAGWNGLAISALARGGAVLGEPSYLKAASEAAAKLRRQKTLMRTGSIAAFAEDYALVIEGMLDLFEATGDAGLLEYAVAAQNEQDKRFWRDTKYESGGTIPKSLAGLAAESDAPLPNASSVSAANLLRLGELTDAEAWRAKAAAIFRAYGSRIAEFPRMLLALHMTQFAPRQIVIAGSPAHDDTKALLRIAHQSPLPFRVIGPAVGGAMQQRLAAYMPIVAEMKPREGHAVAFVCEHYVCKLPTTDPSELAKSLEKP